MADLSSVAFLLEPSGCMPANLFSTERLSTGGWDGQTLTVTLARASSPTRPIAGPTRSPTRFPQTSYVQGYSKSAAGITAPASPISSESMATPPASYQSPEPITIVNYTGVNNVMPLPMDPMFQPVPWNTAPAKGAAPFPNSHAVPTAAPAPMFTPPFDPAAYSFYPYQMPAVPPMYEIHVPKPPIQNNCRTDMFQQQYYHSYGYEMPSNMNNMAAANVSYPTYPLAGSGSGSRSVLIQNLAPDVNQQVLEGHFRVAGTIEWCEIISEEDGKPSSSSSSSHSSSGSRKVSGSYATATFRTEEEAKRAVELCDRSLLMGRKIRVRLDWEAESISNPETSGDIPTPTLTASSSPTSSSSSKERTDNNNHKDSRRDSGKEFSLQDHNNKSDTTTTTAPPHQPLVVNGSCVRRRNNPTSPGPVHGPGPLVLGPNASSLVKVNN
ncbi:RNA binding protein [Rasamsonia emersonii CBS 393.64]|uniref:RNA binding protein n=1 Tax=Rasamsonia emersonii (strain ATCC 16479 / CBS 393.64 / IMI 116815) TaxID=1408163 RepID=A0A0F4YXA1_RASE3|nr:RNA binding protein [Rasamsonia emersonii CBS 393.64]KKA22864.1 RNA binding protein [Rasamsonia emersonii CBS 393.64]